jgi:hypothetical protein
MEIGFGEALLIVGGLLAVTVRPWRIVLDDTREGDG